MKRSLVIQRNDGAPDTELEIGKAALINATDSEFIYIEKMKDGKWRLTATKNTIDDFSKIDSISFARED